MSSNIRKKLEEERRQKRLKDKENNKVENSILNFPKSENIKGEHLPKILSNINSQIIEIPRELLLPASEELNFFKKLSDQEKNDIKISILNNGLLHPIIVWEQPNGKYMILSGHNRCDIYEEIYNEQKEKYPELANSYLKIPAKVFKYESLDEITAEEIIIDTNYLNRKLSLMEVQECIYRKYKNLGRKKASMEKGYSTTRDIIAEEYGLKSRMVGNYIKLGQLINEFKDLISSKELSIEKGVKIANLTEENQRYLYENFLDKLLDKKDKSYKKLSKNMIISEINIIFKNEEQYIKTKSIKIPNELENTYKELMYKFIVEHNLYSNKSKEEILKIL